MTKKSINTEMKLPSIISTVPILIDIEDRSAAPRIIPKIGLMISVTNEATTFDTAPPKIKPTARPTTPCSRTKSINPFIFSPPMSIIIPIGGVRSKKFEQISPKICRAGGIPPPKTPLPPARRSDPFRLKNCQRT